MDGVAFLLEEHKPAGYRSARDLYKAKAVMELHSNNTAELVNRDETLIGQQTVRYHYVTNFGVLDFPILFLSSESTLTYPTFT